MESGYLLAAIIQGNRILFMIGLSYPSFTGNSANFLKKYEEFNTFLQTNTDPVKKSAFSVVIWYE